jgi:hypothetical protein
LEGLRNFKGGGGWAPLGTPLVLLCVWMDAFVTIKNFGTFQIYCKVKNIALWDLLPCSVCTSILGEPFVTILNEEE